MTEFASRIGWSENHAIPAAPLAARHPVRSLASVRFHERPVGKERALVVQIPSIALLYLEQVDGFAARRSCALHHAVAVYLDGLERSQASEDRSLAVVPTDLSMPYAGGVPAYCEHCQVVAAAGYNGFVVE
jgi:hypothetical protein